MQEVYRILARLMNTDLGVMITGESGTGKELVARALHNYGLRKAGPFVAINMAAIPRDLIESELFGHEKGAFTGADRAMHGKFEQARGGTLFLDEVGDMPLDAQTRLLRVLQEGEFTRVGGREVQTADVRIIAATHQDLRSLINEGRFREDLFYRLNVVPIRLPPLRERLEDVPDLARAFLRKAEAEGLPRKTIAKEGAGHPEEAGLDRQRARAGEPDAPALRALPRRRDLRRRWSPRRSRRGRARPRARRGRSRSGWRTRSRRICGGISTCTATACRRTGFMTGSSRRWSCR